MRTTGVSIGKLYKNETYDMRVKQYYWANFVVFRALLLLFVDPRCYVVNISRIIRVYRDVPGVQQQYDIITIPVR